MTTTTTTTDLLIIICHTYYPSTYSRCMVAHTAVHRSGCSSEDEERCASCWSTGLYCVGIGGVPVGVYYVELKEHRQEAFLSNKYVFRACYLPSYT